ncbi:acylglycerol lipase [Strigomonas culicis]|uniref:Acylglycerol lipase n=1 Tax=Strigomonas culicis TaxID=28005 RepID=S9VXK3_9TRYP|nr:acylglycerol lipase [Strigomonas culicis]|eukprot:EPY31786.1 acylglycerol lipase [Strigomonas culicis]
MFFFFNLFTAGHNLPYATPSRAPPDPRLFPRYIQNKQGLWLRFMEWWPRHLVERDVKGIVFIVCGLGEHTGRYDAVALRLNREGYAAFAVDNQGSGGSEGLRLYVENFFDFVDDVELFVNKIQDTYPALREKPRFLLGHSMGGLIATHLALRHATLFAGVVLSGPAYRTTEEIGSVLRRLVFFLSSWVPKLPVRTLDVALVSHNVPVVELVRQDPYYSNATLRARFSAEFLSAQEELRNRMAHSTFPFLIVHGKDDMLCSIEAAREFHRDAVSSDKQMVTYAGAYHEVLDGSVR